MMARMTPIACEEALSTSSSTRLPRSTSFTSLGHTSCSRSATSYEIMFTERSSASRLWEGVCEGVFAQTMEGHGASVKNETYTDSQTSLVETLKQHASSFSTSVESCVNSALVWAQTVKRAADGDEEAKVTDDNNDSTKNDPTPTMVGAEKTLQSAMSVRKLLKVARYAREACESLSQMTDAAHEIGINTSEEGGSDITSVVAAATARAAELFPLLSLLQNAFQRSLAEYVAFHRASAKLEAVLSSLAVGICLEGFCVRPDEQDGGEGDESGKMMDDVAGTGMGEGEGKKENTSSRRRGDGSSWRYAAAMFPSIC